MKRGVVFHQRFRTSYVTQGQSKEGVVFLHGDGQNQSAGRYLLKAIPKQYKLVAIDAPGHGLSEDFPDRTLTEESELVSKILKTEDIEKATIIGHSKGANLAAMVAIMNPKKVRSLVLINPFFRNPRKVFFYLPIGLMEKLYIRSAEGKYCNEEHTFGDEDSEKEIRDAAMRSTPIETLARNLCLYKNYDIRTAVQELDIPILIIASQKDMFTSKRHISKVAKGMRNSKVVSIEGSHNCHILERESVGRIVTENLQFLGLKQR